MGLKREDGWERDVSTAEFSRNVRCILQKGQSLFKPDKKGDKLHL